MNSKAKTTPSSAKTAPDYESATAIVEVKSRISAVRDLRDALVELVVHLDQSPPKRGYLLLVNPRMSESSLRRHFLQFKSAMRPDIAEQLQLLVVGDKKVVDKPPEILSADWELLTRGAEALERKRTVLPRPDKKSEVFRVLLLQWLLGEGPMTSKWLEDSIGCNFRTVAATIDRLGPAIYRHSNRRVELKYFPEGAWQELVAISPKARTTMLYQDRSDQPRSPESLFRRYQRLGLENIAVGGVLGARRHYPDLDITGAPRLDLCIKSEGMSADLSFVQQLDPALERIRSQHEPARLALHFVRRVNPFFEATTKGVLWADPVECLLDLNESRLTIQASAFTTFLTIRAKKLNARS